MARIFISCVPSEFNDIVRTCVESKYQGGGNIASYEYDERNQCATVDFIDEADSERLAQRSYLELLSHRMPILRAESEATIFVYNVPPNFIDDLDCILESPRRGGGPIEKQEFMKDINCTKVTFEDEKVAHHFVKQGVLRVANEKLPISCLPPSIFRPQYRYALCPDIITREPFADQGPPSLADGSDSESFASHETLSPQFVSGNRSTMQGVFKQDDLSVNPTLTVADLPRSLTSEHLKLMLESSRFGGDVLKFYEFDESKRVARFSYVDSRVAHEMLAKGRISFGQDWSMNVHELPAIPANACDKIKHHRPTWSNSLSSSVHSDKTDMYQRKDCYTVELKTSTKAVKEQLILYVENRRSGGGPTRNITELDPNTFIITFECAEDAKSFCSKDHFGYFKGKTSTVMLDSWPEDVKPCAILVENVGNDIPVDMLKLFFEHPNSGGRPESVEQAYFVREGVVCFVFNDSDAVDSILLKKNWKYGDRQLKVVACMPSRPPPMYDPQVETDPKWLLFTEIRVPSLSHRVFKEYLSYATHAKVDRIHYFKEHNKALVKFVDDPDFEHILRTLCSRPFQGTMISVEKVPAIDSILVECKEKIAPDLLKLYFENSRSGGGMTERVYQLPDGNAWVVQFVDRQVVDRVVTKSHVCGKFNLSVKPFLKC